MDKWTELRTAYQVAKLGTVSAAATALGFHRATVNRHIDTIEEALGSRIFLRHGRGYTLTELGEEVLRVAQKTEALIEDLAGRAKGGKTRIEGEIKLSILEPFSPLIMAPLRRFRGLHPACRVDVSASEDLARLEYGEAHIALRAGAKPSHPDYVVGLFARMGFNLYAHDKYIERHGMPENEQDLHRHFFVAPPQDQPRLPYSPWLSQNVKPGQLSVASLNPIVNFTAIAAGLGIGFLSDFQGGKGQGLHRILPPNEAWQVPLWLVTHVDLHRTEKVQSMLACLKEAKPTAN